MRKRTMRLVAILAISASAVGIGSRAKDLDKTDRPAAADVAKPWFPRLKSATDYQHWGGSPESSPDVAAYSFRVAGPTFGEMWSHYAGLCGVKTSYAEKSLLISANDGPKGSYVVLDRSGADGKGGRGMSTFLLRTEAYTVTVTFGPDPGSQSISGSLSAVVR